MTCLKLSIIPQVLSLEYYPLEFYLLYHHLHHEPDQGGAGHSQSDLTQN